ncbi:hypothetical protein [Nocardioides sp.]|uniref:hypothetical protein n=1 Tax=Nocardioides sp. TaxID=35761 RepID=UPI002732925A|nr:hypothetical protein [Nocardioides sp.]MDP3889847.1 hypothetical protein [Nocardioides sp.]
MKVRIALTVEIDEQVWAEEYGLDRTQVRADVRRYVTNAVDSHLSDLGLGQVDHR